MSGTTKLEKVLDIIQYEPNYHRFMYKNFKCVIRRNMHSGILCGYVGLPITHKYYKKNYDDIPVDVHGGLTFANELEHEADGLYYIGFDCAHWRDLMPFYWMTTTYTSTHEDEETTYKTFDYVQQEIKNMVDQLVDNERKQVD
jgi:hypothetical protein